MVPAVSNAGQLPCNIVGYEQEGHIRVAAVEPETMLFVVGKEMLWPIVQQVREDLTHVVEELAKR